MCEFRLLRHKFVSLSNEGCRLSGLNINLRHCNKSGLRPSSRFLKIKALSAEFKMFHTMEELLWAFLRSRLCKLLDS